MVNECIKNTSNNHIEIMIAEELAVSHWGFMETKKTFLSAGS